MPALARKRSSQPTLVEVYRRESVLTEDGRGGLQIGCMRRPTLRGRAGSSIEPRIVSFVLGLHGTVDRRCLALHARRSAASAATGGAASWSAAVLSSVFAVRAAPGRRCLLACGYPGSSTRPLGRLDSTES